MSGSPKNFSDAIADLERKLTELSGQVGEEAVKAKKKVENKVEENPWAAIGLVGLIFFILGFLFASKRRD